MPPKQCAKGAGFLTALFSATHKLALKLPAMMHDQIYVL